MNAAKMRHQQRRHRHPLDGRVCGHGFKPAGSGQWPSSSTAAALIPTERKKDQRLTLYPDCFNTHVDGASPCSRNLNFCTLFVGV